MSRNVCIALSILFTILSCKNPEARRPIQNNSGSFMSNSIERNKSIFEKEKLTESAQGVKATNGLLEL